MANVGAPPAVKACVESLPNKPEFKPDNEGIYVEVSGPNDDGKYSAQRFEIKDDGRSTVADDKLPANSTYYKVDETVRGGNRKNRKSSRKNRKSSKKNRKSSSSRRSRK